MNGLLSLLRPASRITGWPVGRLVGGDLLEVPRGGGGHLGIFGRTGAGKSGVVNALLDAAAYDDDLAMFGVDLKGGLELDPWRARFAGIATDPADATELLDDLNALMDWRFDVIRRHKAREWRVEWGPFLLIVIDEWAEVASAPANVPLLDRLGRMSRAPGMKLVLATQRPSIDQLGGMKSAGLRAQLHYTIALGVRTEAEAELAAGMDPIALVPPPHKITQPGACWWIEPGRYRYGRVALVTDDRAAATARKSTGYTWSYDDVFVPRRAVAQW